MFIYLFEEKIDLSSYVGPRKHLFLKVNIKGNRTPFSYFLLESWSITPRGASPQTAKLLPVIKIHQLFFLRIKAVSKH